MSDRGSLASFTWQKGALRLRHSLCSQYLASNQRDVGFQT